MDTIITAIYENGVLRLLTPLALPEHTEVQIAIKQAPLEKNTHRQQVIEALIAAGLSTPSLAESNLLPLSEQARKTLAEGLAASMPVSEMIIEEREGR